MNLTGHRDARITPDLDAASIRPTSFCLAFLLVAIFGATYVQSIVSRALFHSCTTFKYILATMSAWQRSVVWDGSMLALIQLTLDKVHVLL